MTKRQKNKDPLALEKLRQSLENDYEVDSKVYGPTNQPQPDSCYYGGLGAFSAAVRYGSVCSDLNLAQLFFMSARANLELALEQHHFPAIICSNGKEDLSNQKSTALFCYLVSDTVLSGNEIPSSSMKLSEALALTTSIITEKAVIDAANSNRSLAEQKAWSQYVIRYIGRVVVARLGSEAVDYAHVVDRLVQSSKHVGYMPLIQCLNNFLDDDVSVSLSDEKLHRYNDVYRNHVTINNYAYGLIDGFLMHDALLLSIIRSKGNYISGVMDMFKDSVSERTITD